MRRLDIRLPADHFIFDYPDGTRTAVATALINIGEKVLLIENKLSIIDDTLTELNSKLDNFEQKLEGAELSYIGEIPLSVDESKEQAIKNIKNVFDIF